MSPSHNHVSGKCLAVREVLNRVGDKWSVQVVGLLGDGKKRFSELRRTIEGISQRMLALTLKGLERDGLITRTVYPIIPPRVEYELTKLGHSLLNPIKELGDWAGHLCVSGIPYRHFITYIHACPDGVILPGCLEWRA
jgi:DNA-binding HxlR family transcriptional regulator